MATSLRAFQAEIDTLAAQRNAQQRQKQQAEQLAQAQQSLGGSTKSSKPKEAVADKKEDPKMPSKTKPSSQGAATIPATVDTSNDTIDEVHAEPTLEDILLDDPEPTIPADADPETISAAAANDPLTTHIASRLLANHGEYLIALGSHPHPSDRYQMGDSSSGATAAASAASGSGKDQDASRRIGRPIKDDEQLVALLTRIRRSTSHLKAHFSELYSHTSSGEAAGGPFGTWMIRSIPNGVEDIMEVRVAVVGNVDAGKSTMLGVLTRGGLDDGRGKARVALFRHKHEVETGRTSSVGMEIIGFTPSGDAVVPTGHNAVVDGQTITTAKREKMSWDEICSKSAKIVSFIDLAGHERYLRTTLFGLTGCAPDYVMLIVGGNAGLIGMSKEHLGVALALQVPVIICVTKIDMTPAHVLEQTVKQLIKVLKSPGCRKTPVFVESAEQAIDCARHLGSERICPVFLVSNVTGANLPLLRTLLNALPSSQGGSKYIADAPFEFNISDVFSVPFSGSVASGVITSGTVKAGDSVLLGPDSTGQFLPTVIKSIQRKRANVEAAEAGQSVSFALKKIRRSQLRKGMVLVGKTDIMPKAVRRFEGQVLILYHNTTIAKGYQAVLHVNSVRQTVRIVSLDHPKGVLRTGDRAKIIFEFIQGPEFIREGARLLFRENKTKGLGVVTKIDV